MFYVVFILVLASNQGQLLTVAKFGAADEFPSDAVVTALHNVCEGARQHLPGSECIDVRIKKE